MKIKEIRSRELPFLSIILIEDEIGKFSGLLKSVMMNSVIVEGKTEEEVIDIIFDTLKVVFKNSRIC